MKLKPMTPAQRAACDAIFAKIDKENLAAQKAYKPKNDEVANEAAHLKSWSKGKPIQKATSGTDTFWTCGKWSTKIQPKVVEAMVKQGLAQRINDRTIVVK